MTFEDILHFLGGTIVGLLIMLAFISVSYAETVTMTASITVVEAISPDVDGDAVPVPTSDGTLAY